MKLHKKLLLAAVSVLVLGSGTGVAFAMHPPEEPKKVVAAQEVAPVKTEEVAPVVETPQPAPQPAAQTVAVETPPAPVETLQKEAERRTRQHASKFGLDTDVQWHCTDRRLAAAGYENEADARDILEAVLLERNDEQGGYTVAVFDGYGSCSIHYRTIYL